MNLITFLTGQSLNTSSHRRVGYSTNLRSVFTKNGIFIQYGANLAVAGAPESELLNPNESTLSICSLILGKVAVIQWQRILKNTKVRSLDYLLMLHIYDSLTCLSYVNLVHLKVCSTIFFSFLATPKKLSIQF